MSEDIVVQVISVSWKFSNGNEDENTKKFDDTGHVQWLAMKSFLIKFPRNCRLRTEGYSLYFMHPLAT